jgi:hypothetical protein
MAEGIDHAMKVPPRGAVARMYCTGLGDCFLLGFPDEAGEPAFMLIDCGVLQGSREARPWMQKIMRSIVAATGERGVEVLVATHKHWDHLSGFQQAAGEFRRLRVKRVWLSWPESPTHPAALQLAVQEEKALRAIRAVALGLAETDPGLADDMRKLLGFDFGVDDDVLLGAPTSTAELLELVRERDEDPLYLEPCLEPQRLEAVPGVNFYVLGPPTDLTLLRKSDPSSSAGSEVYTSATASDELGALFAAAALRIRHEPTTAEEWAMLEFSYPFEADYGTVTKKAAQHSEHGEFFRRRYGFAADEGESWRRIDNSWLRGVEQLALNFNNYRNNTSLALAIELGDGGPVLLFPGDAQVGNWLSWHRLEGSPSAEDLLRRTTLYKVGHHASHNATLRKKGLELMTRRSRLVAMISVDEKQAHNPKGRNREGWDMPHATLLRELEKRTEGRVLRADLGVPLLDRDEVPEGWSHTKWEAFRDDTLVARDPDSGRLFFVQYTVRP